MIQTSDDLRKSLTAAEAYNRYMEKRVRFLEMELEMYRATNQGQPNKMGGGGAAESSGSPRGGEGGSSGGMTTGHMLEELVQLRQEHKHTLHDFKALQKEHQTVLQNLQHMTAKEQQQRQRATAMTEEVRQLRDLLPRHLFSASMALGDDNSSNWDRATTKRGAASPSIAGSVYAAGGGGIEATATASGFPTTNAAEVVRQSQRAVADTKSALQSIVADSAAQFQTATTLREVSSAKRGDHPMNSIDFGVVQGNDRVLAWKTLSYRVHTVLQYSKRTMVEEPEKAANSSSAAAMHGSSSVVMNFGGKSAAASSPPRRRVLVDQSQQQLEALLQSVDPSLETLKNLLAEVPRVASSYMARSRAGVSIVVEGQGCNTPASHGAVKTKAVQLVRELQSAREECASVVSAMRSQIAAVCGLLMTCIDASVGTLLYRPHPQTMRFLHTLEGHVATLLNFDIAVDHDLSRTLFPSAMLSNSSSSSIDATQVQTQFAQWLEHGNEVERTLKLMSEIDPMKNEKFQRLDITAIKKMSLDSSTTTATPATALSAESAVLLETIRTCCTQLLRLFRGETVLGVTQNDALAEGGGGLTASKGVQCNLQQQKMQMTDNELHIARLAGIKANWFESAVEVASPVRLSSGAGKGGPHDNGLEDEGRSGGGGGSPASEGGPRSRRRAATNGGAPSVLTQEALFESAQQLIHRLKLPVPANFAPSGKNRSAGHRFSNDEEHLFQFGRRLITLHGGSGGPTSLAVHVGGGYITFEEFCRQHGPAEMMMLKRRDPSLGGASEGGASYVGSSGGDADIIGNNINHHDSASSPFKTLAAVRTPRSGKTEVKLIV